jgi:hypothetical protein
MQILLKLQMDLAEKEPNVDMFLLRYSFSPNTWIKKDPYENLLPWVIRDVPEKQSSGSGTGSTQPREYNWGATW